jgi:hypothetical protein
MEATEKIIEEKLSGEHDRKMIEEFIDKIGKK